MLELVVCSCSNTMNSIPRTLPFYLENQNFHVVKQAKLGKWEKFNPDAKFNPHSVTFSKDFWDVFSWSLVYFPQYHQIFIDLYCFSHFQPLLLGCMRCSFEQNIRKLIVYLRNLSGNIFFLFFIFRGFFWAPIRFNDTIFRLDTTLPQTPTSN